MKKILVFLIAISFSGAASASPNSLNGAKMMSPGSTAHQAGLGWPSSYYEWWHAGHPDWALGAEIVYGDWSGEFSDVEIGLGLNVPMRWHIHRAGRTDVAFRLAPGALIANVDAGPNDRFAFGARMELGVPVSIQLDPRVNLITGGNIPTTFLWVEGADPFILIPIYARIGVEVEADPGITPWILLELGPALAFGDFGSEVEFGFRVFIGSSFF